MRSSKINNCVTGMGKQGHRCCIVTGDIESRENLIRFVITPTNVVIPDLREKLPGRGLWVTARREIVEVAIHKGLFAKAARTKAAVGLELADDVEKLLVRRACATLGLARKAGDLITGFEKVMVDISVGRVVILIEARDSSVNSSRKLDGALKARYAMLQKAVAPTMRSLWREEMGLALGRTNVVHAALTQDHAARKVLVDFSKLESYGRSIRC
jgi:predicted RNA-binding protein YlxR (DUF448 family)